MANRKPRSHSLHHRTALNSDTATASHEANAAMFPGRPPTNPSNTPLVSLPAGVPNVREYEAVSDPCFTVTLRLTCALGSEGHPAREQPATAASQSASTSNR